MKYKYNGLNKMTVSSNNEILTVSNGDIVDFNAEDIKLQDLKLFSEVKTEIKKKNKNKMESE